jgi:hypothetical protein
MIHNTGAVGMVANIKSPMQFAVSDSLVLSVHTEQSEIGQTNFHESCNRSVRKFQFLLTQDTYGGILYEIFTRFNASS